MLILRAAYGRKYRTREEALKDWEDGKDFKIKDGPYLSVRDSHLVRNHVLMIEFGPNNKCITRAS